MTRRWALKRPQPRGPEAGSRRAARRCASSTGCCARPDDGFAAQGLQKLEPDQALALAIAGETLRRLPDCSTRLIDGATRQRCPTTPRRGWCCGWRWRRRIALNVPDHALVATALPLVDGGPRRLVHGVLGTLLRGTLPAADEGAAAEAVEQRWTAAWGERSGRGGPPRHRPPPAARPQLRSHEEALAFAEAEGGVSLAERHVRLPMPGR
jgi:16S rRNA (cytosine967-C5)-methyltransferase